MGLELVIQRSQPEPKLRVGYLANCITRDFLIYDFYRTTINSKKRHSDLIRAYIAYIQNGKIRLNNDIRFLNGCVCSFEVSWS